MTTIAKGWHIEITRARVCGHEKDRVRLLLEEAGSSDRYHFVEVDLLKRETNEGVQRFVGMTLHEVGRELAKKTLEPR